MGQSHHQTDLASEFYVISVLFRLGYDAHLTLGNKKAVDIVVVHAPGDSVTIDVKAVAGPVDWLAGNIPDVARDRHFVVLLTYDGKFNDVDRSPRAWVLRHDQLLGYVECAKPPSKMKFVRRSRIRTLDEYREAWHLLGPQTA